MMRILITGSSGYVGNKLAGKLSSEGYNVVRLKRDDLYGPPDVLATYIKNTGAIIHLAGAGIFRRWTKKNKTMIYDSRVLTTRNLVEAIKLLPENEHPGCFVAASAIGIYSDDRCHTETSRDYNNGFLGKVVMDWEDSSDGLPPDIRRVICRTGVVIGQDAPIIRKMMIPFRLGLGGKISTGKQPFPFIHIHDLISFYADAAVNNRYSGIYNLVAPENITNADFSGWLASVLNRPSFIALPGWLLKAVFGKASSLLLKSPVVIPEKLNNQGFKFSYPTLMDAVQELTGRGRR